MSGGRNLRIFITVQAFPFPTDCVLCLHIASFSHQAWHVVVSTLIIMYFRWLEGFRDREPVVFLDVTGRYEVCRC